MKLGEKGRKEGRKNSEALANVEQFGLQRRMKELHSTTCSNRLNSVALFHIESCTEKNKKNKKNNSPTSGLLAKVMSSKRMLSRSLGESPLNHILIKLPATKASFGCSCVCHHSASNTCDSAGPPNFSESQVPEQMYLEQSTHTYTHTRVYKVTTTTPTKR